MATLRMRVYALGAWAIVGSAFTGQMAWAQKAEEVLARKPVPANVLISTPAPAEMASCRVEQIAWPKGTNGIAPAGLKVIDPQGRMLRQFIDTNGGTKYNIVSYYLEGVESFREIDSSASGKPDQFRWFGINGSKWGSDSNKDGLIDNWYVISPEEVSQELFAAVATKDRRRLEALLITEEDIKKIGLPAVEADKIKRRATNAAARMMATSDALKLGEKAKWIHLELGLPQTTPADAFGGRDDLMKHRNGAILVDKGDNKAEVFQTGEMILVGRAWKLVDGPAVGTPGLGADEGEMVAAVPKVIEPIIAQLTQVKVPTKPEDNYDYHMARAKLLEDAVAKTSGAEQVPWLKQLIDAYTAAVESNPTGDKAALPRLTLWKTQIMSTPGAGDTQAYISIRVAAAEYASKLSTAKGDSEFKKVHATWREQLESFVKNFPTAPEAPDALMRLAVAYEFDGKDGDAGAKAAYEKLTRDYPSHPLAQKAAGAVKRLQSEGQPFQLSGNTVDAKSFTEAAIAGKTAVVFYWATWANGAANELKALADLEKAYSAKGLVIVTVNMDEEAAAAIGVIRTAQLPGFHLHAAGGLDRSPLANAYGVQMVPHIMIVGKDGKVVNRSAQGGDVLKNEIEKLLK